VPYGAPLPNGVALSNGANNVTVKIVGDHVELDNIEDAGASIIKRGLFTKHHVSYAFPLKRFRIQTHEVIVIALASKSTTRTRLTEFSLVAAERIVHNHSGPGEIEYSDVRIPLCIPREKFPDFIAFYVYCR
jgi:hypothetical protein